jgi:hypothetical protein
MGVIRPWAVGGGVRHRLLPALLEACAQHPGTWYRRELAWMVMVFRLGLLLLL